MNSKYPPFTVTESESASFKQENRVKARAPDETLLTSGGGEGGGASQGPLISEVKTPAQLLIIPDSHADWR